MFTITGVYTLSYAQSTTVAYNVKQKVIETTCGETE